MRIPGLVIVGVLGGFGATAAGQESHDALAVARAHAAAGNVRVLLVLSGGDAPARDALEAALPRRLLRNEYVVTGQPAGSVAARALRERLGLGGLALPALAVLDSRDRVLGALGGADTGSAKKVEELLETHRRKPLVAREVLARGLASAKESGRHVLLYLSAPS